MPDNPFKVSVAPNPEMGAWDIQINVGGFESKEDADRAAKAVAEWIAGESGWTTRTQ